MLARTAFRSYTTHNYQTAKVFNRLFKPKGISSVPMNASADQMRSKMALYLIDNKDKMHNNYPELLWELQQHHSIRLKELESMREIIQKKIKELKSTEQSSPFYLIEENILKGIEYQITVVLNKHRRQIRKVNDVKHQDPSFWDSDISVKRLFAEE